MPSKIRPRFPKNKKNNNNNKQRLKAVSSDLTREAKLLNFFFLRETTSISSFFVWGIKGRPLLGISISSVKPSSFFHQKLTGLFSCRFRGLGPDLSWEDSCMKQPWNACRIWSRLGYSGRKAVVFLPIEISLEVVLNIPVVILCWAITQFIPHLWYISQKALVTDDTVFSSVESSEGKATPRGAKFHFLRAFSSVAYEIHPRDSPPPFPSLKYLLACCKQQFDRASIPTMY